MATDPDELYDGAVRHMDLLPEERKILDSIESDLCAAEPRLASKLRIFTRLTADDGQPPEEDLAVSPGRPSGLRGSGADADSHGGSHVIIVLLVVVLAVILILSLTGFR